jgi:hypothetical protein
MPDSIQTNIQSLQPSELIALVSQAIGQPCDELLAWQSQPITAVATRSATGEPGVFRLSGMARTTTRVQPWSLILKVISGSAQIYNNPDPAAWNYWKREALVYQSGLLAELPGALSAPRCYVVTQRAEDEFWLWLEDIHALATEWTMAHHALAARHLGQFNGAYLAGYPLPASHPWLSWGRVQEWLAMAEPLVEQCHQYAETPVARRLFVGDAWERTLRLWAMRQPLLAAFERLPICFCHHDAYRRNLLLRTTGDGQTATVAIDWGITGFGRVGEDAGMTTAVGLGFLEVPSHQARELDQAVFTGYIDGLREAGWRGDMRLARFGYAVNAATVEGIVWMMHCLEQLQTPEGVSGLEAIVGHPADTMIDAWATMQPFLLDLGEEALTLLAEV